VIRELEGELAVQNADAYRDRVSEAIAITTLLRLVQDEMERSRRTAAAGVSFRQYTHYQEDERTLELLHRHLQTLNVEMVSYLH